MADKLPTIISVLALVISVIAVILGGVSLAQRGANVVGGENGTVTGQTGSLSGGDSSRVNSGDDRIWTISIGHSTAKTEYLDEVSGQIKGFNIDIVNAVCKFTRKNCRIVADIYTRCWDSVAGETQRGGTGLFAGYYDACTGWFHTYVRSRTFAFSDPYSPVDSATFFVKPGASFNPGDITNKKIGFVDGWVYDEFCVARQDNIQGVPIAAENVYHYDKREDLLNAVLTGEVDAGFDTATVWEKDDAVDTVADFGAQCAIGGRAMMMRKDNMLWQWWNPAFQELRSTKEYKTICEDLLEQHGHVPGPNPEDICFDYK